MTAPVASMEKVHQRAGEQQEIRQRAEKMGSVLGHEEERGDGQEAEEDNRRA